jgi:hypothetical protein
LAFEGEQRRAAKPFASQLQRAALSLERAARPGCEGGSRAGEVLGERAEVGDDEPRRSCGCRSAHVRGEIRERRVLLVADGRDDRNRAVCDGAHEPLVAERQKILEGAAAAGEHDDVDLRGATELLERFDERARSARALHVGLGYEQPRRREARGDRRDDVALRRRIVAGEEADAARDARERALALGCEEALVRELALEPFERGEVVAEPEALDRERSEAEVGAGLEELGTAVDVDALAVGQLEAQGVELSAGHRDGEAGAVLRILEREEDALPALLSAQFCDLAFDPDRGQAREPRSDSAVERGDAVDAAVAVLDRLNLHPP